MVEDGGSRVVSACAVEPDGGLSPVLLPEVACPNKKRFVLCRNIAGYLVGEKKQKLGSRVLVLLVLVLVLVRVHRQAYIISHIKSAFTEVACPNKKRFVLCGNITGQLV